jgi:tetratricopeptide (TPR) repeat protein
MVQAAKEADEKAVKEAAKKAEEQQRKLNDLRSDFTVFKEQADDAYYTGDYAKAQRMYARACKAGAELVKLDLDYERKVDDVKDLVEIFNANDGERLAKLKERASYVMSRLDSNPDEAAADYKFALTIAPDDPELHAGLKKALAAGPRAHDT